MYDAYFKKDNVYAIVFYYLSQGWGTCNPQANKCGSHEHLIWPA